MWIGLIIDVPEDVVVELVVTSQGDHGAKSNTDGVKHLGRGVHPHLPQRHGRSAVL